MVKRERALAASKLNASESAGPHHVPVMLLQLEAQLRHHHCCSECRPEVALSPRTTMSASTIARWNAIAMSRGPDDANTKKVLYLQSSH